MGIKHGHPPLQICISKKHSCTTNHTLHNYTVNCGKKHPWLTFWWLQGTVLVSHHPWSDESSEKQLQYPSPAQQPQCDCSHHSPAERVSSAGGSHLPDPSHGPQTAIAAPLYPSTLQVPSECVWTVVPTAIKQGSLLYVTTVTGHYLPHMCRQSLEWWTGRWEVAYNSCQTK